MTSDGEDEHFSSRSRWTTPAKGARKKHSLKRMNYDILSDLSHERYEEKEEDDQMMKEDEDEGDGDEDDKEEHQERTQDDDDDHEETEDKEKYWKGRNKIKDYFYEEDPFRYDDEDEDDDYGDNDHRRGARNDYYPPGANNEGSQEDSEDDEDDESLDRAIHYQGFEKGKKKGARKSLLDPGWIARQFQQRGLSMEPAALDGVVNVLKREIPEDEDDEEEDLEGTRVHVQGILRALMEECREWASTGIVTESILSQVVASRSRNSMDVLEESLQLLNAYETPQLNYNATRKHFVLHPPPRDTPLIGTAMDKVNMYVHRLELIQQRMLRHELFRPNVVEETTHHRNEMVDDENEENNTKHVLTPVESLLGSRGVKFLLGMIVQVEEGEFYLEDMTSQVLMDLSAVQVLTDGYITETCIVLVEGEFVDGLLVVHRMGFPLVETRRDSMATLGPRLGNLFSTPESIRSSSSTPQDQTLLEQVHGPQGMFVVLSDVHLDNPAVLEKLKLLLQGYSTCTPLPVFIFMGNFFSSASHNKTAWIQNSSSSSSLSKRARGAAHCRAGFDALAALLGQFPRLAREARMVFIPGLLDPPTTTTTTAVLPRPPLAPTFTKALRETVTHLTLATNPCRLRYFSREIVFFRHDLISKLRRYCLLPPPRVALSAEEDDDDDDHKEEEGVDNAMEEKDDKDKDKTLRKRKHGSDDDNDNDNNDDDAPQKATTSAVRHAVKTILDQSHLCPLSLEKCPVYWKWDHALRLYPLPDAIVYSDDTAPGQYYETYAECDVINPGPFYRNFDFVVYRPIAEQRQEEDDNNNDEKEVSASSVEFSHIDAALP